MVSTTEMKIRNLLAKSLTTLFIEFLSKSVFEKYYSERA